MLVQLNIFTLSDKFVVPIVMSAETQRPVEKTQTVEVGVSALSACERTASRLSRPPLACGGKAVRWDHAGALWELRRALALQRRRVCGKAAGEIGRCTLVHRHVHLDGECDLRREGRDCLTEE